MYATVTSKGQITLPKALRERLRLSAGDRVEFVVANDDSVRLIVGNASITSLKGLLPKPARAVSLKEMAEAIEAQQR